MVACTGRAAALGISDHVREVGNWAVKLLCMHKTSIGFYHGARCHAPCVCWYWLSGLNAQR